MVLRVIFLPLSTDVSIMYLMLNDRKVAKIFEVLCYINVRIGDFNILRKAVLFKGKINRHVLLSRWLND